MKIIFIALIVFCGIISSNTRLIEKITDRTLTTERKTASSSPVRLAREAKHSPADEILTGISKREDYLDSNKFLPPYTKRMRQLSMPKGDNSGLRRLVRKPRDSSERLRKLSNETSSPVSSSVARGRDNTKVALVKKPIPKYNEMDVDDDFQMKISKSPAKIIDSGEHEDEDFNLNDYDFDVNHDEFLGRGTPLEPKLKHRDTQVRSDTRHKSKAAPEIKVRSKFNKPGASNKKERSAAVPKKPGEKEDYYDDFTTTTKAPEATREPDDDEDNEEYDSKLSSVRRVRSPWKINGVADKHGDNVSGLFKTLSILPVPQIPSEEIAPQNGLLNFDDGQSDTWSNKGLKN